jgi:PEP-CTERM motif
LHNESHNGLENKNMKFKSALLLVPIFAASMTLAGGSASAGTYRSFLEYSGTNLSADYMGPLVSNKAGVIIVEEGGFTSGHYTTLDFTVQLFGGNIFVDTGRKDAFVFNLTKPTAVTYSGITTGFANDPNSPVAESPFSTNNSQYFTNGIMCVAPASCNGSSAPTLGSFLHFKITDTTNGIQIGYPVNLVSSTINQLISTSDPATEFANITKHGWWFAADILWMTGDGQTRAVGARDFVSFTAVPEPETYTLLAAGLGLMGFVAARRRKKIAA